MMLPVQERMTYLFPAAATTHEVKIVSQAVLEFRIHLALWRVNVPAWISFSTSNQALPSATSEILKRIKHALKIA